MMVKVFLLLFLFIFALPVVEADDPIGNTPGTIREPFHDTQPRVHAGMLYLSAILRFGDEYSCYGVRLTCV